MRSAFFSPMGSIFDKYRCMKKCPASKYTRISDIGCRCARHLLCLATCFTQSQIKPFSCDGLIKIYHCPISPYVTLVTWGNSRNVASWLSHWCCSGSHSHSQMESEFPDGKWLITQETSIESLNYSLPFAAYSQHTSLWIECCLVQTWVSVQGAICSCPCFYFRICCMPIFLPLLLVTHPAS